MSDHLPIIVLSSPYGPLALTADQLRSALLLGDDLAPVETAAQAPSTQTSSANGTTLVDANIAARVLGVGPTWLLQRAREQRVPHYRIGKYIRFDPAEIRAKTHQKPDRHANS